MSDLITRKPTPYMVELLRRGAASPKGIMTLADHNDRTQDGILRRDMGEVVPEPGATHSWLVINEKGRAYVAKLDGTEGQQEADVIETPAAERHEPCIMRSPQQAGTHARAYFTGHMVKVGTRGDGSVRRVHVLECRACGKSNMRGRLEEQPCTEEREAEVARLRAITQAPTREGKRAAVRAVEQEEAPVELDMDLFRGMVGTERTEVRKLHRDADGEWVTVELRYRVEGVKFKGTSRYSGPSVTVWGYCVSWPQDAPKPTYENSSWAGAWCAEIFYANPVEEAQEAAGAPQGDAGAQEAAEGAEERQEGRGARLVRRVEEREVFGEPGDPRGGERRTVLHWYSDGTRVRLVLDRYADGERLARVTRFAAEHVNGVDLPTRRRVSWWGKDAQGGQRFACCGCVSCREGRGACVKVPTGPAWGVQRPDGKVVGPFARHADALRYGRNVVRGGTPVPLEPVAGA